MRNRIAANFNCPTVGYSEKAKISVLTSDGSNSQLDQEYSAPLQELIKRQTEDVESKVYPEDGIGQSVRTTVTESKIRVPLRIETDSEHSRDCYRDEY